MKNSRIVLAALFFIALVAGLFWYQQGSDRPLDKVGSIRFAASLTVSPAPIWIALEHGLFAKAGLDAVVEPCTTGKSCTEAMLKGEADLSAAAEFLAARVAFSDKNLRLLSTLAFVHTIKLQSLKESGIVAPADLKGKRVGVKMGTNGEYFLARLLTLHDMDRDDITWMDLKPQLHAEALATGEVDAVLVWPPFTNRISEQFGDQLVEFDGQPGQDYYYLVMGRAEWLKQNPKVAERAMLALKWAEQWMKAHPLETRAYLTTKFGLPPEELKDALDHTRFDISLPQTLLSALEAESRWLVKQQAQGTPVANSLDLIAFEPLSAVAPESVTIIHRVSQP